MSRTTLSRSVRAVLLVLAVLVAAGCKQDPPKPGQEAFDKANASITVFESQAGFGNTPAAKDVANRFATELAKREAEAFEGGKEADDSLTTQGKWLTHCQDHASGIVFLVHVPHLDTYAGEDRKALAELAWETAVELSAPMRKEGSKKIVVALRGNLLFGALAEGSAGAKPSVQAGAAVGTDVLYPFFHTAS